MEQRQEAGSQSGTRRVSYVFQEGRINKIMKFNELVEIVLEKVKRDRCLRKADSVYGKKTSAYKSGAVVKCRQGKIWKKK